MLHALSSLPPDDKAFFLSYTDCIMPITISATIQQSISTVWNCFTSPEHITQWNQASADWHCPKAEIALEQGGTFLYTMAAKDGSFSFDFGGTFDEIIPQAYIAYTLGDGRRVKVTFEEMEDHVRVTEQFDPEHVHSEEMQQQGWQSILDSFKAHCESI